MLQEWEYKTKIKDVHKLPECIVDEWDKLDQCLIDEASSTKPLQSGKRDLELVWLQEYGLNKM